MEKENGANSPDFEFKKFQISPESYENFQKAAKNIEGLCVFKNPSFICSHYLIKLFSGRSPLQLHHKILKRNSGPPVVTICAVNVQRFGSPALMSCVQPPIAALNVQLHSPSLKWVYDYLCQFFFFFFTYTSFAFRAFTNCAGVQ